MHSIYHASSSSIQATFPANGNQRLSDEMGDLIKLIRNANGVVDDTENLILIHLQTMVQRYPASEIEHALNQSFGKSPPASIAGKLAASGFGRALRFAIDHGTDLVRNEAILMEVLTFGLTGDQFNNIFDVLKDNKNINWNLPLASSFNRTRLGAHVAMGNISEVQKLLTVEGVDPNSEGTSPDTPLGIAVFGGSDTRVNMLIASPKINVNKKNRAGQTPIEIGLLEARQCPRLAHQYADVITLLVEHPGFDLNTKMSTGESLVDYATQNGMPALAARLKELQMHRLRQQSEEQFHEADRIMAAVENRLGNESIHCKRLQALDIRSRQYCAHLLEPLLQQQAAKVKRKSGMTAEKLKIMEAAFSTAVSAALDKLSAMQADKLNGDVARRLTKGSALRTLLEQLTPTQRLDAARLLAEGLSGKSPREINKLQLESMVHKALDTLRHAEKRDAGTEQRIDLPRQDHWPDLP